MKCFRIVNTNANPRAAEKERASTTVPNHNATVTLDSLDQHVNFETRTNAWNIHAI